jgi:hypothetical protein
MTFVDIVDAVLADAFAESRRLDAQTWVNFRLAWIWDVADWTFADATDAVTVTSGSQIVSGIAADIAVVYGMWRSDGTPLMPIENYSDFAKLYVGTNNTAGGLPEAYTVLGTSVFVGPTSSETNSGYLLSYQKAPTLLVNDSDVPGIPAGYHLALVHGGKAEGFKLTNVPLAQAFDADFQAAITAMQHKYLDASRPRVVQAPAYR